LQYDIVETPYFLQTLCQIKIRLTDSKNIQKQTVSQNNTKGDTAQTISNKIDPSKINVSPKHPTNEEYFSLYSSKFNDVKLEKIFDIAPLYGDYADALNNILFDMETDDSLYSIFKNTQIKNLHDKNRKVQEQALMNYTKYANPKDEDAFFITLIRHVKCR
jgi:hypothetical protein